MLPKTARKIFISYAHEDEKPLEEFLSFIQPLVRQGDVTVCSDRDIRLGDDWHQHLQAHISGARAAVLLVSPDFLNSEYIANSELPVLLKNAHHSGVRILPILVSPSLFSQSRYKYPDPKVGPNEFTLATLQAANSPSKTLSEMTKAERRRVFTKVAESLLEICRHD